jgi:hypothetical protein
MSLETLATGSPKWLRVARSGSTFTAAYSTDGGTWTALGSASVSMPADVLVGMAVSSGDAGASVAGTFQSFGVASTVGGLTTYTHDAAGNRTALAYSDETADT